jgi:hypothetical protein
MPHRLSVRHFHFIQPVERVRKLCAPSMAHHRESYLPYDWPYDWL